MIHPPREEALANMHLITAAPDLYEALEKILKSIEYAYRAHPAISGKLKAYQDIARAKEVLKAARGEL